MERKTKTPRLVYSSRPRARLLQGQRLKLEDIKRQLIKRMSDGICIFDLNTTRSNREQTVIATMAERYMDRSPESANADALALVAGEAGRLLRKVEQYLPVAPTDARKIADLCEQVVNEKKGLKKHKVARLPKHNENEVVCFDIREKRLITVNIHNVVRIWHL